MVAYLFFPLSYYVRANSNIAECVVQEERISLFVSPFVSGLTLFSKLLLVLFMINTLHAMHFKHFYTILECACFLLYAILPDVAVEITDS